MRRSRAEFDLQSLNQAASETKPRKRSRSFGVEDDLMCVLNELKDELPRVGAPVGRATTTSVPVVSFPSLAHQEMCFFLFQISLTAIHVEVRISMHVTTSLGFDKFHSCSFCSGQWPPSEISRSRKWIRVLLSLECRINLSKKHSSCWHPQILGHVPVIVKCYDYTV